MSDEPCVCDTEFTCLAEHGAEKLTRREVAEWRGKLETRMEGGQRACALGGLLIEWLERGDR